VGSGRPATEGTESIKPPESCSPQPNSLACEEKQAKAEDVSIRLRQSVISEVGAGRGATEGKGAVKSPETCEANPGALGCR
jgi:hypothetical protein